MFKLRRISLALILLGCMFSAGCLSGLMGKFDAFRNEYRDEMRVASGAIQDMSDSQISSGDLLVSLGIAVATAIFGGGGGGYLAVRNGKKKTTNGG